MKSISCAALLAMIALSIITPARAEFIADQSRISVVAPMEPGLDHKAWLPGRGPHLLY